MRVLRGAVGLLGELLITAGLFILAFVVWQLWWTDVEANRAQAATISSLERGFGAPPGAASNGSPGSTPTAQPAKPARAANQPSHWAPGAAFAILRIPRLGADYARPILEGTDHDTLTEGLGHYPGTAGPGEIGNFALAGHRTTYGRPLHEIDRLQAGDKIVVETKDSYAVYAVASHEIVLPSQVSVVAPVPDQPGVSPTEAWMTLTACHPAYSAAQRYVVHARLVGNYPRADGLPAGDLAGPGVG
jgi:sortase A